MAVQKFVKDPDEFELFGIDWTKYLGDDEIEGNSQQAEPSIWVFPEGSNMQMATGGIYGSGHSNTKKITKVWLKGGLPDDEEAKVTNRIATKAGRVLDRTLTIQIREK